MREHLIRRLEELSLNAWPALQTAVYDGWLLRFADGYTRRANSAYALYPSTLPIEEKLAVVERLYAAKRQDSIFKLTDAVLPSNLDAILAEQGYRTDARTSVQTLSLSSVPHPDWQDATFDTHLTDAWLDTFCRLNSVDSRHRPTMTTMLHNIVSNTCFASLQRDGETVAVGLAVHEGNHVGLFDVVTAAHLRGQGVGTQLILHLLHWAKTNGATGAYLQVMESNAPALRLYDKLGFREQYRYWYRVKSLPV